MILKKIAILGQPPIEIKMIINNNYCRIDPPINIRGNSSVWMAVFLCLLIFPGAVFAAKSFSYEKLIARETVETVPQPAGEPDSKGLLLFKN